MPFCDLSSHGSRLYYRTYGQGSVKVLLITGLAGTYNGWAPQIRGLTGSDLPNDEESADAAAVSQNSGGGIEVCAFDNRGMGRSSIPSKRSSYSTKIMANDAISLMDHLGWEQAHVFGHSMGGMIACKLASMVPWRVSSLALINVTGGGFECFPKFDRKTLSVVARFLRAKTAEQRAAVDLDTHYSKEYLKEYVGSTTRREILYHDYVKKISAAGMQSNHGFGGQVNACWTHKMKPREIESIRSSGFLVSIIHGRADIIAQLYHARKLAKKLHPVAKLVDLPGGHLVTHERVEEVNQALLELIRASEAKISPQDWTNLSKKNPARLHLILGCISPGYSFRYLSGEEDRQEKSLRKSDIQKPHS